MRVKNGNTFTADHEPDQPEPKRPPTEKTVSRGSKDLATVPAPPAVTNGNPEGTHSSAPKPVLVLRRSARPSALVGERRLSVPAPHGGVTIVAQKGAVLNVTLEVVVHANSGQLGARDSKVPSRGHAIDVENTPTVEGDGSPTKPANTEHVATVGTRKRAKKDGTP